MTAPNPQTDPAGWWDNLVDLHPPEDATVAGLMDITRKAYKDLGHWLIAATPPGPDLTVALRSLKDACQHAIANIACNQARVPRGTLTAGRPIRDNPQA